MPDTLFFIDSRPVRFQYVQFQAMQKGSAAVPGAALYQESMEIMISDLHSISSGAEIQAVSHRIAPGQSIFRRLHG